MGQIQDGRSFSLAKHFRKFILFLYKQKNQTFLLSLDFQTCKNGSYMRRVPIDNSISKGVSLEKAELSLTEKTYLLAIKMTPSNQVLLFDSNGKIAGGLPRVKDTSNDFNSRFSEYYNPKNPGNIKSGQFRRQKSITASKNNGNSGSNTKKIWCQDAVTGLIKNVPINRIWASGSNVCVKIYDIWCFDQQTKS